MVSIRRVTVQVIRAEPGSSVGHIDRCQSRVCEFESKLGQHYFRCLTKVNRQVLFFFHILGNSLCGKATGCSEIWCVENWYEASQAQIWVGELAAVILLNTCLILVNQSINHFTQTIPGSIRN